MNDLLNPIAEVDKVDSGIIVTPKEAVPLKEKEHSFVCPDYDCKDPERKLILKKSKLDNYFFSHRSGCEHEIRPETLLHKLAIKWFEGKTEFEIPECIFADKRIKMQFIKLDPLKTCLEYSRLKTIIPDVKLCSVENFEFAIEIVVTNDISDPKRKLIQQFGLPTLKIDLSGFYDLHPQECRINKIFVEQHLNELLTDSSLKKWVDFPNEYLVGAAIEIDAITPKTDNVGCMVILPLIGVLWLFSRIFQIGVQPSSSSIFAR